MRPGAGYVPVESSPPLRGLATTFPSNKINPAFSPDLRNCTVRDGTVRRRAGGVQLGRRLVGAVMAITEFGELGETPHFIVLTSHRHYAYDPGLEDFVDLTPGQVTYLITATVQGLPGSFTIAGDHAAAFPEDLLFPVIGGDNQDVYTVVSAVFGGGNTVITVLEPIPFPHDAGNIVNIEPEDVRFVTPEKNHIEFVTLTDEDGHRFLITNGENRPRTWSGNLADLFVDWEPNFTDFFTCKTLTVFNEHLFLGNVTTGTVEPLLIAWSNAGEFDEFESGTAGVQVLHQLTGGIRATKVLGDRLAIYSYDVIMAGVFVGIPAVFAFEVIIPEGTRLISPKAISSINVGHIYVSEENFYLFDGTRGLRVIGDNVYTDYKGTKDHEFLYKAAVLNDFSKRTLFFSIPDLNGGTIIYTALYNVFNLGEIFWAKEKYLDDVRAWGFFINRQEILTWDDASWEPVDMKWEEEIGNWGEEGEQLEFPIRSYGTSQGRVLIVTEGVLADRGVVAEQRYDTKDFEVPEIGGSVLGRWGEVEVELTGTDVRVFVSGDKGFTFTQVGTLTLNESPKEYQVPIDVMSRTLRVRLVSTTNFAVRWVSAWVRPGGPQ